MRSFAHDPQSNRSSPRKGTEQGASMTSNTLRSRPDPNGNEAFEGGNPLSNPKVEVYKVTDLLNSERNRSNLINKVYQ